MNEAKIVVLIVLYAIFVLKSTKHANFDFIGKHTGKHVYGKIFPPSLK